MVYELRVYHIVPGRMPAIIKRFDTVTCRLFEKHGIKQVGFWTVAIGESTSDLVYMLQWESMADRDKKFATFRRRSRMDRSARQERRRRTDSGVDHQQHTDANKILRPEISAARRQPLR